jgi:peptide/nickel transport system permease protein
MIDPSAAGMIDIEGLREALGLNKPLPVRYVFWLKELCRGNVGYSYRTHEPIADMLRRSMPPTLVLIGVAVFVSTFVGILLGVMSALWPYSLRDYTLTVLAFVGVSMPDFFFGLILIFLLAGKLRILPSFGMVTAGAPPSVLDRVRHMIMPALVLSFGTTASIMRYARASMLEVLHAQYLPTARAKGLAERTVIWRHAFRNALLPLITVIGHRLPWLFSGSLIVETIFSWPGTGKMLMDSVTGRDYPGVMAVSLVVAASVLLANLIADIAYAFADPQIRYE